jgi:hypothetical protein
MKAEGIEGPQDVVGVRLVATGAVDILHPNQPLAAPAARTQVTGERSNE